MLLNISDQSEKVIDKACKYQLLLDCITDNKDRFYRLAFCYAKTQDGAMDIVQEAIVKALRNVNNVREPAYVQTWFYRIVVNESLQYLRKNKNTVSLEAVFNLTDEVLEGEDDLSCMKLDLYRAIDELPSKLKTVIVLRYFEDLKLREIAEITKSNCNTVKSRLRLALEQLQKCYKKEV